MPAVVKLDELLAKNFSWLVSDRGYRTVSYIPGPGYFDRSTLVLESPELLLRFTLERGYVALDVGVASQPGAWWNFVDACEAIFGERPVPELEGLAPLLAAHYDGLTLAFGEDLAATKRAIETLEHQREGQ